MSRSHEPIFWALLGAGSALGLAALISLLLFHAAHRILHTLHDVGVRAGTSLPWLCYGSAAACSALAVALALSLLGAG
jgi:fumarate reductase subunit D